MLTVAGWKGGQKVDMVGRMWPKKIKAVVGKTNMIDQKEPQPVLLLWMWSCDNMWFPLAKTHLCESAIGRSHKKCEDPGSRWFVSFPPQNCQHQTLKGRGRGWKSYPWPTFWDSPGSQGYVHQCRKKKEKKKTLISKVCDMPHRVRCLLSGCLPSDWKKSQMGLSAQKVGEESGNQVSPADSHLSLNDTGDFNNSF